MGHDISAAILKKDLRTYEKQIAGISATASTREIDFLYSALGAIDCNNGVSGNCEERKYTKEQIQSAIHRLKDIDNPFVQTEVIPFLQKVESKMKDSVWIFFA